MQQFLHLYLLIHFRHFNRGDVTNRNKISEQNDKQHRHIVYHSNWCRDAGTLPYIASCIFARLWLARICMPWLAQILQLEMSVKIRENEVGHLERSIVLLLLDLMCCTSLCQRFIEILLLLILNKLIENSFIAFYG